MSAEQREQQGKTRAHIVASALKRHGVEVIFGQSIPAALFLVTPQYGIRQVGYRAENAGSYMADASYSSIWVVNTRFVTPRGLAGLGWGVPYALRAKIARPEAPVIALVGDGR